jgi:hypothetical protein
MIKRISAILGLILAIAGVLGVIYGIDSRYAHSVALAVVAKEVRDVKDQIRAEKVQERVWKLEEWYDKKPMPAPVKQQYQELKKELEDLKQK